MRVLCNVSQQNGGTLQQSWHVVLATLQHLSWLLNVQCTATGQWRSEGGAGADKSGDSQTVLTTAVMADLPIVVALITKLLQSTA